MHTIRVNSEKSKSKKVESGHYTFPNCYTLCSTKEAINNTASFGGYLEFQERSTFTHPLWVKCSK